MGACQGPHEVGTLSLVPTPTGVEVLSIVLYAFLQSPKKMYRKIWLLHDAYNICIVYLIDNQDISR